MTKATKSAYLAAQLEFVLKQIEARELEQDKLREEVCRLNNELRKLDKERDRLRAEIANFVDDNVIADTNKN